jgi:4-hydroxy-tetrahydrodipicolinate reductase
MGTIIYLQGTTGRMGKSITALIENDPAFSLTNNLALADVAVDVSAPSALPGLLQLCLEAKKPLVIGTTGYNEEEKKMIEAASQQIPLLYAPNFSFGMALLKNMVSELVKKIGNDADIKIVEEHHANKKDTPSGSALALAQIVGKQVPIDSKRSGDTIGDHTVIFDLGEERLELKHSATSRAVFAQGALRAALFLKTQPPGYYTLCHLLK